MSTIKGLQISYRELLKVAIPLSFGAFVQFVVVITDNYFVAQINDNAMSGASFVGLIYVMLSMLGYGLSNAVQILVARRKGGGQTGEVGRITANGIVLAFLVSMLQFVSLFYLTPVLLDLFIVSDTVRAFMNEFIEYRSFGFFFYTLVAAINAFWSGIAVTRIMIFSTLITAVFNIILDYALVFGNFGMPQMGVSGAALATTISEAAALIFVVLYTVFHKENRYYHIFKNLLEVPLQYSKQILKLGGPIMLQLLVSLGVWVVFYNFVEKLGEKQLHSSLIIRNMYMMVWVSVMGFSTTAKTYVSGLIAEGRQDELWIVIRRLMLMNLCGILILSHGLWMYPEWIITHFTHDAFAIEQTKISMYVVLPAMCIFAFTSILLATVEGSGNTVAGFAVEMITTVFYIGLAYYLAIVIREDIYIVWMSDYLYFACLGIFSAIFMWNGKWKTKQI